MWMQKSAIAASKDDLVTAIHATLPNIKQLGHSIVLPTPITGGSPCTAYTPSTARPQSVDNDHLTEVGHMRPQGSTSPPTEKSALRSAISEPLTDPGTLTTAPRALKETRNGECASVDAQQALRTSRSESEVASVHKVDMEPAQARQLAESEAETATLQSQAEHEERMRKRRERASGLKTAVERESKVSFDGNFIVARVHTHIACVISHSDQLIVLHRLHCRRQHSSSPA